MYVPLTLAMAGLAEAGEYFSILFWRGVIGVALLLAVLGFFRRSRNLAWIALVVVVIATVAVQPWTDFMTHPLPEDPDVIYWLSKWRELSIMLIGASVLTVLFTVGTIRRGAKDPQLPAAPAAARDGR